MEKREDYMQNLDELAKYVCDKIESTTDDSLSLGIRVAGGRAALESFDGKPVSLEHPNHSCASDVVRGLRFSRRGRFAGVVGVVLD
ncbi:MAG: hypothetical protein H0T76_08030 [Nannocystis sp.]|nr:hypothetical protein [Nannocystis sp.]MBA3546413.1 hypothetical protein [Nannocystis sp.]